MIRLVKTSPKATLSKLLSMLLLISMSLSGSGCKTVTVISGADIESFVKSGESFTPEVDGVYMSLSRYQRYRRAVADEILEEGAQK